MEDLRKSDLNLDFLLSGNLKDSAHARLELTKGSVKDLTVFLSSLTQNMFSDSNAWPSKFNLYAYAHSLILDFVYAHRAG